MSDSIRLGRIRGIKIGLHWSVAIFAAFISWNLASFYFPEFAPGHAGGTYAIAGLMAATLLGASILAHELGHSLVAIRHGIKIDGITLWLMGGVARLESDARTPRHAFEIAAAGPAVSVAIAFGAGLTAAGAALAGFGSLTVAMFVYLGIVNAGLALFNLIPALPLDGGRILQAWKWHKGGDREYATVDAAKIGRVFGWMIVGVGLMQLFTGTSSGLWGIMVGLFVISQAKAERRRAERQIAMRDRPAVPAWAAALGRLLGSPTPGGPVIDVRSHDRDTVEKVTLTRVD